MTVTRIVRTGNQGARAEPVRFTAQTLPSRKDGR
jgi:hypothetical protein